LRTGRKAMALAATLCTFVLSGTYALPSLSRVSTVKSVDSARPGRFNRLYGDRLRAKEMRMRSSMGPAYDAIIDKIVNPPPLFDDPKQAENAVKAVLGKYI